MTASPWLIQTVVVDGRPAVEVPNVVCLPGLLVAHAPVLGLGMSCTTVDMHSVWTRDGVG